MQYNIQILSYPVHISEHLLLKKTIHEITRTETARHKHPKTHVQGPPCALFCASVILSGTQRQRGALHQIGQRFGNDRMCESRIS